VLNAYLESLGLKFKTGKYIFSKSFEYTYANLWGATQAQFHDRGFYFFTIINDYLQRV